MKNYVFIFALFIFGNSILPKVSYACGSHCHSANRLMHAVADKSCQKSCCQHPLPGKHGAHNDCGDHCNCRPASPAFAFIVTPSLNFSPYTFFRDKKNIELPQPDLSPGFSFIWRPPKIAGLLS